MCIIVYDIDCKEKTIEFHDSQIEALKHKARLESYGSEVAYVDLPQVSVSDAEASYEATR